MKKEPNAAPQRLRWIRKTLIVIATTAVSLWAIVAWFTRPAFVGAQITTWFQEELGLDAEIETLRFRPFRNIQLTKVRFSDETGANTGKLGSVDIRYRLVEFLRGTIRIDRVWIDGVELIATATPSHPMDRPEIGDIKGAQPEPSTPPAQESETALWPNLAIRDVLVTNVLVSIRGIDPSGSAYTNTLDSLALSVDQILSGSVGELRLTSTVESQRDGQYVALSLGTGEEPLRFTIPEFGSALNGAAPALSGVLQLNVDDAGGEFDALKGLVATTRFTAEDRLNIETELAREGRTLSTIRASSPLILPGAEEPVSASFTLDHHFLDMVGVPWGLHFDDTALEGALTYSQDTAGTQEWSVDAQAKRFSVRQGDAKTPVLDWSFRAEGMVDANGFLEIEQENLNFTATRNDAPYFDLALLDDWSIASSGDREPSWPLPPPVQINLRQIDWKDWAFLAPEEQRSWRGIASAQIEGRPTGADGSIDLTIGFEAKGLELGDALPVPFELRGLTGSLEATVAPAPGESSATFKASIRTENTGTLDLSGAASLTPAERIAGRVKLTTLGEFGLNRTLEIVGSSGLPPNAPIELELAANLDPTPLAPKNALRIEGRLPGSLNLTAESFDTGPLMAALGMYSSASPAAESSREATQTDVSHGPLPNPYPADWEPTQLQVEIGSFAHPVMGADSRVETLTLKDVVARGVAQADRISVKPITFALQGGNSSGEAEIVWLQGAPRFSARFETNETQAGPFLASLGHPIAKAYTGLLDVRLNLNGALENDVPLHQSIEANLSASLSQSNLLLAGFWENQLLKPLAAILRVPELVRTPIDAAHLDFSIKDGVANIADATLQSAIATFHTQGIANLAQDLLATPLSLPIEAKIDRKLLKRAGLDWLERQAPESLATLAQLPQFIQIAGLLGKPQADLNSQNLLKLALQARGGDAGKLAAISGAFEGILNPPSGGTGAQPTLDLQGLEGLLFPGIPTNNAGPTDPATPSEGQNEKPTNDTDAALRLLDGFLRQIPR